MDKTIPRTDPQPNPIEIAYRTAIDSYQFQIQRYNTWMNYFALFSGALFVAYYTVMDRSATGSAQEVYPSLLGCLIAALGWVTALCWYASSVGYHTWNTHWIRVIQQVEKECLGEVQVYRKRPEEEKKDDHRRYLPGYVSTQKILRIFILGVACGWGIAFVVPIGSYRICWLSLILVGTAVLCCLFQMRGGRLYSSRIE